MSKAEIKKYLSKIGRKGGSSKSPAKLRALKISLAKARATLREIQNNNKKLQSKYESKNLSDKANRRNPVAHAS